MPHRWYEVEAMDFVDRYDPFHADCDYVTPRTRGSRRDDPRRALEVRPSSGRRQQSAHSRCEPFLAVTRKHEEQPLSVDRVSNRLNNR